MNIFSNIFKYAAAALAAVAIVEQTAQADKGKAKQQKAIDLINGEAQVAGFAVPSLQPVLPTIVNLAVAGFNMAGVFQHGTAQQPAAA